MTRTLDPLSQILFSGGQNKKHLLRQSATLCAISDLASLEEIESALRDEHLATQDQWQRVWGPFKASHSLFLVFYHPVHNRYALVVKGPNMSFGSSFIEDWFDKFDIDNMQSSDLFPVKGAKVNHMALKEAENLLHAGNEIQTLVDYLIDHLANHPSELWVVGHGMGGAISGILALALHQVFQKQGLEKIIKILPMSFGSPAVGNFIYVSYFNSIFPYALRTHNTLDVVPYAWNGLEKIQHLYPQGPSCPEVLLLGIQYVLEKLAEKGQQSYLQNASQGVVLNGSPMGNLDYQQEVLQQHTLSNYLSLLGVKSL